MADRTESEQLEKRGTVSSEPDPITERSMSGPLLVSSLLMVAALLWAIFDETFGQRPWRDYQQKFVDSYLTHLERIKPARGNRENEIKESPEYEELYQRVKEAEDEANPKVKEIDQQDALLTIQLNDITPAFQDLRAKIAALSYEMETVESQAQKNAIREDIQELKEQEVRTVAWHNSATSEETEERSFKFNDLEKLYNEIREEKARLVSERLEATKKSAALRKELDEYVQEQLIGLSQQQVQSLIDKMNNFTFEIKQIDLGTAGSGVVDRCASCHLGATEPLTLTARNMGRERAFTSHPDRELLKIHDPSRFGCSTCHGGNGRATTSVEKAHGRYKHWLWPLYYKENVQAGCNQCHDRDRVTAGADVLNHGKDLFQNRGCVGCHRYEGFDRETDALTGGRQAIKQLELERTGYRREITQALADAENPDTSEDQVQQLLRRADSLRQTISRVNSRIDELDIQSRYLLQDQKKVGPNLKEIKLKLNKDWLPVWLRDPQAFRPGTKMPSFRLPDDEIKAISAFLWQSSLEGPTLGKQPLGDAAHGKELFKTRGCLGCHSIDGKAIDLSEGRTGGDFAADLSRLGEKANYDYIVRWVHNPRQRTTPYCPTEKRDLTPADYQKKGLPFVFDSDHSKCPNDGHELQIQNMTVMPNFRLSDQDARDIATFLTSLKRPGARYQTASYLDDGSLKEKGQRLVRFYGCAGCHEVKGFEEEQRIGTELTKEGSKPIERLDFAVLSHDAMSGIDPLTGKDTDQNWYNHKGFFENKLRDPAVYDRGKERAPEERLRMPNIYLQKDDVTALTTFLLGSVESALPASLRYAPTGHRKDAQEGWWVIKKYNCMGCHNVLIGQDSVLMNMPMYQDPEGRDQLPPRLTTEGARVNPDWLLKFLKDPSMGAQDAPGGQRMLGSAAQPQRVSEQGAAGESALGKQPGANRNGVRPYLRARMPTFNFSPNELQALVNFFMGASFQPQPYIAERLDPLTAEEQGLARSLFTSTAAPCLKCHITGDPAHDAKATAPNFLLARERLKPAWTERWLIDPAFISPGTSMPSGLFKEDQQRPRWLFAGPTPPSFQAYERDHVELLVRYMFQITPEEQRRLMGSTPAAAAGTPPATTGGPATGSARGNKKAGSKHVARAGGTRSSS